MPGPRSAELNGLNWQVQVDPLTLSITSLPPILPVLAGVDPDEVFDELPPHAASSMHSATTDMRQVKRFIDTLRFPSGRSPAGCRYAWFLASTIWKIPKQNDYISGILLLQLRLRWQCRFQF